MGQRSTGSISEGEIAESGSEKATTSTVPLRDTHIDPRGRHPVSVSRSPSPYRASRYNKSDSRDESRSSRHPRHNKRPRDAADEHYDGRHKHHHTDRAKRPGYTQQERSRLHRHDQFGQSSRESRRIDRTDLDHSRSPPRFRDNLAKHRGDKREREYDSQRRKSDSRHAHFADSSQYRGRDSNAKADSERRGTAADSKHVHSATTAQDEPPTLDDELRPEAEAETSTIQQQDEAAIIEARRLRREAIKRKHLEQLSESKPENPLADKSTRDGDGPETTQENKDEEDALHRANDELIDKLGNEASAVAEDGPSAADYDPTQDMQEDMRRYDEQHVHQDDHDPAMAILPKMNDTTLHEPARQQEPAAKPADEFDMFAETDDMFASTAPAVTAKETKKPDASNDKAQALDVSMLDDWDDHEGYYKIILGELLDGRYHVQSSLGKGMFSAVVRAGDRLTGRTVAIKIIRNNETMRKAGLKEIEILQKLLEADPEDKRHLIRLERSFDHKQHLCMVFENLSINLREVLKKFGRDVGINLRAVRTYAHQMFLGLGLMRKCEIIHADLKPDNMLINEARSVMKICDLGSATDSTDNEITQYLVSRFYRAPEIILGTSYDAAIDMWSIGCTLFELYTGKILFTGRSNNQMLRAIMECRGKISHKLLRKAQFLDYHFDDMLNFKSVDRDRITGKESIRLMNFAKPSRDLRSRLLSNTTKGMADAEIKELNMFIDLLDKCLALNPEKRCTPAEALKHPFISRPSR